jgi:hypothetical protein
MQKVINICTQIINNRNLKKKSNTISLLNKIESYKIIFYTMNGNLISKQNSMKSKVSLKAKTKETYKE